VPRQLLSGRNPQAALSRPQEFFDPCRPSSYAKGRFTETLPHASSAGAQVRETSEVVDIDVAEDRAVKEPVQVLLKSLPAAGELRLKKAEAPSTPPAH
jgi:hypothetical protein